MTIYFKDLIRVKALELSLNVPSTWVIFPICACNWIA